MKTYRDVLNILQSMPEDQLDDVMVVCDSDDNYRGFDGYWKADGTEGKGSNDGSYGRGRRPKKGRIVLVMEEYLYDEE